MAINKIVKNSLGANAVDGTKIEADAIDATKIADDSISEEHLDVTSLTGHAELSATAADDDVLLVFDTSAGSLKKIQRSNVALSVPTFSSVSPTSLLTGDGTGNHTIVVTGTKFDTSATFKLRTNGGTDISMDSVTRNSPTQLTGTVAKSTANLTNANEPFDIIISNGSGLNTEGLNQLNIDASPVYVTAAGSLGTVTGGASVSLSVNATDPESAGNVTFELQSGSLPPGLSLTNTAAEGGTAIISGTATNPTANTTSNFVLRAVDAASNTTSRAFSITVNRTFTSQSFTSSGTFAVPSGVSSLNAVLVVAAGGGGGGDNGGGGGAGGLIFMPEYPVTPGGTVTVTVGCGSAPASESVKGNPGQDSVFAGSPSPGIGQGGVLTAKGGGAGAGGPGGDNQSGGSGGGAGGHADNSSGEVATQPTQPGNSGAYGFGNAGGNSNPGTAPRNGGGGGGAGAVGGAGGNYSGQGGDGKAYTIGDGTTPVYYAGGGGGGTDGPNLSGSGGNGGGGGGGSPCGASGSGTTTGDPGTANRGGGGGAGANANPRTGGTGGKGIVIVRY